MKKKDERQYRIMTEAPVAPLVIKLGIPTTISMLVSNIYNLGDTYFVSQLGTSASGAVGIVFGFMAVLQAIGFLFGQGAGSLISRSLGDRDEKSTGQYATISFVMAFCISLVMGILCFVFLKPFLRLLGSTETILPYASDYVTYIIISGPFMVTSFVMNNILRFEGKANLAMIGLVSGAVLNLVGDPILIFGLGLGISGAGISTCLSQLISFGILLSFFLRGKTQSRLSIRHFRLDFTKLSRICTTGFPSLARQGLQSISTMQLNNFAAVYGDTAVAAMSIVSRLAFFIFAVSLGIGQGFQPVCGYNYGAKKYSRVRKAFVFTLGAGEVLLGTFAVVGMFAAPVLIGLFRKDPEVLAIGTTAFRFQCVGLFFQPLGVMSNMTFQSTGKVIKATISSLLRSGLFFLPILFILGNTIGLLGIQMAQPLSDFFTFLTVAPMTIHFFKTLPSDGK